MELSFEMEVTPDSKAKYLDVWLHKNRAFIEHAKEAKVKADKVVSMIDSLMNNADGSKSSRTRLL